MINLAIFELVYYVSVWENCNFLKTVHGFPNILKKGLMVLNDLKP